MSKHVFKLPDLGEGTVEAEIVEWHAEVGDAVHEDQTIVEVMTDKASVEVPATGVRHHCGRGQASQVTYWRVGAELVVFETTGDASTGPVEAGEIPPATSKPAEPAAAPTGPASRARAAAR